MNYSLIIPVYNEIRTLTTLLDQLERLNKEIEIIIIDDGSTDGSQNLLSNDKNYILIKNKFNIGKGSSIIKGVEIASKENIILMDSDLEINFHEIPFLIEEYDRKECDAIAGVRWNNSNNKRKYNSHYIGNYVINFIFNLLFNSKLNDVLCCLKILKLKKFKKLNIKSKRFSLEVEIMAKMAIKNMKIKEFPIKYTRRSKIQGKKIKFNDGWGILWTMIKIKYLA